MVTGSLQAKAETYYAVFRIPDNAGRIKQKWISTGIEVTRNNKRQANARLREIIIEVDQQKLVYTNEIKFVDWLNKWMEQKKNEIRLNSYEGYESYVEQHIIPYFEPLNLTLRDVSAIHIQDYYNTKKAGSKKAKALSSNTIKKHNTILRGALLDAVRKNIIPFNPTERATLPPPVRYKGKAYTLEQANMLLRAIKDDPVKPAIILGLFYGLRRSEVLGLRWQDIDFKNDTIFICNTVVRTKTIIESEQTKSDSSNRTLYIVPETKDYLLGLKKQQKEYRRLMGDSYHENNHVCVWEDGRKFRPNYPSMRLKKILKANNLPQIRFHDLRHTAGSLLLSQGLSVKQIQEYLGHERVSTTLDIYGHLSIEGKKESSVIMGGMLAI